MTPWSFLLLAAGVRTLVLPFENVGGEPSQSWKGSAFEEAISVQFESAGHDVVDLEARNRRMQELGFSPSEPVSRATAITLGKDLSADRLVVGAFWLSEDRLEVEARLVDLEKVATVGIVEDFGPRDALPRLSNQVAKNLFRIERDSAPMGFDAHAERRVRIPLPALESSAKARVILDPAEQRSLLESALAQDSRYLEARLMLGRLLLRMGEPRAAIDVLVAAGDEGARYRKAYFDLGLAYLEIDEPVSAAQIFGNLAKLDRGRAESFNNQGVALMRLDRPTDASEAFALAAEADPDDPIYAFNLGWSYWRQGKGSQALDQFEKASELMPCDGELYLLLSAAAASQARVERAEKAKTVALVLSPQLADVDPAVVTGLARTSTLRPPRPEPDDLLEDEDTAASLEELFDVHYLREHGRLDEAIQLLQQSLYHEPGDIELRRELVELHREAGELDKAARELSMLLWTEPNAETYVELARLYVELGESFKAFEQAGLALELDPEHREAQRLRDELAPPPIY